MKRAVAAIVVLGAIGGALWYLRDPTWLRDSTSGMTGWHEGEGGIRFRWTTGHSSFFVPADSARVTIPLRVDFGHYSREPFRVRIDVNDNEVATVVLANEDWTDVTIDPTPYPSNGRWLKRIDLYLDRCWGDMRLGVQIGDVTPRGSERAEPRSVVMSAWGWGPTRTQIKMTELP